MAARGSKGAVLLVVLILILLLPLCNLLGPLVAVRLYVGEDQTEGHTR